MSELAPMREQVYTDPRPKEYFDRFHERARTREPDSVYEAVRVLTSLYAYTFLRTRAISTEHVPGAGGVILAPNHFSFMDHFLMGCYLRRKVRFMAKSQLFKPPMQAIYTHGGVFPVRRGAKDEDTFITAEAILARGGAITMYCEGGRSRTGKVAEQAKAGIGRLALETGVPVVPIAIYGSSRVRNWKRLQFPKVTVQYGEAICWDRVEHATREQQQAVADQVLLEIRALYAGLEREGRRGVIRRVREQRRAKRRAHKGAAVA
jgi:1-acyl-sn-glycerol-3-phosphate acyltransferase